MNSIFKFSAVVLAGWSAAMGMVQAAPVLTVPEPGSMALVGLAIAVLVAVSRKGRK